MKKTSLIQILAEEDKPSTKEDTIWVLLDTFQGEEQIFTGASRTREGIEKLKQYVINRYSITKKEQLDQLKIFEVPLDTFFYKRLELDREIDRFGDGKDIGWK
jgi:hypothetical protein